MSHFTVAVITKNNPTNEELTKALQPYHEYECTGFKDQYVVPVDETDEQLHSYNNDKVDAVYKNGKIIGTKYDKQFNQFWQRNDFGYSSNDKFVLPKEYELKETNVNEIYSFVDYLTDYCGDNLDGKYTELTNEGRFIRYTNPNSKWDWWQIGGRWNNMLLSSPNIPTNSCKISSLDIESKQLQLSEKAHQKYDYFEQCIGNAQRVWTTWADIIKDVDTVTDEIRAKYKNQPTIQQLYTNDIENKFKYKNQEIDNFLLSRDEYVKSIVNTAFVTYNILIADNEKNEWIGGEMGWFGIGSKPDNWNDVFHNILKEHHDHYITIVDCHC